MVRRSLIRAFALFMILAAPARAFVEGWPALYDVSGVSAGDVLNVRSEPSASGEVIGNLAPDATGVEVVAVDEDETWGLVNFAEGSGWVSLAFLARRPDQLDGDFPQITSCGGTEPFWDLDRRDGAVTLSIMSSDDPPVTEPLLWERGTFNNRHRYSFRTPNMVGMIAREYCNDGMSDREFGLELNLILLDREYHLQGCCSIRPPAR